MLLFLAFDTTYKTEVKLIFPRHVKAGGREAWSYYSSMQFDIQRWIEVSSECDVPAALTPPHHPRAGVTRISWQEGQEGHSACLETSNERR